MLVGDVIGGRLRIDRILGVGGFGVVAAATHLELRQEVAIKMLRPEFTNDDEIVDRFLREARAVAALRTEHVCRVFDVARTEMGEPYIVMELLHGNDVAQLLRREAMPPPIAVDFIIQALLALAEAHPLGIVHRDLKPPNLFVMRRPDGTSLVKVLDFGIAKAVDELRLTHSSNLLGSPQYMSPEQINTPRDVDPRTDIWSIGVTLYHMLARRLPFPSAQIAELCVMITTQPPAPIDVDPGLRAVIWRCLEKEPAARFQSAKELAAALAPFGASSRHASVPPGATGRAMSMPPGAPAPNAQTMASMSAMPSMASPSAMPQMAPMSTPPMSSPPMSTPPMSTPPMSTPPMSTPPMSTPPMSTPPMSTPPMSMPPMSTSPPSMPLPVHVPTAPSMPMKQAPLAAAAAPQRSRAMLLGVLAVSVLGVGGLVGYLALSKRSSASTVAVAPSSTSAPSSTPSTTAPPSTPSSTAPSPDPSTDPSTEPTSAPTTTSPSTTTSSPRPRSAPRRTEPAEPPPFKSQLSPFEADLLKLEGRIAATPKVAAEYPDLVMSATQMACAIRDRDRAQSWFEKLTVEEKRKRASDVCKQYNIAL